MKTIQIISKKELYSVPLPSRTASYTPVSHRAIIERMEEEADKNSLTVQATNFISARNGKQVIGYFDINGDDEELGIRTIFRNSYDKSMSAAITIGSVCWICSNGLISGELATKRVHKGGADFDIDKGIVEGFKQVGELYNNNLKDRDIFKAHQPDRADVARIIGDLFLDEVISTRQLNILSTQLTDSINFNHLGEDNFSFWDLYSGFTESLKVSHPLTYIKDHTSLHKYFNEYLGYV